MSDKKITLEIEYDKYPELYTQLEKIMNKELITGDVKSSPIKFIESEQEYLNSLVKLDKVINGLHLRDDNWLWSAMDENRPYTIYYDARYIERYSDVPDRYLYSELSEYIDNLSNIVSDIYMEIPFDLINSYLVKCEGNKRERRNINECEGGCFEYYISKDDQFSLISYYANLIKAVKDELESRNRHEPMKQLPELEIDNEFKEMCNKIFKLSDENHVSQMLSESKLELFGDYNSVVDEILMYIGLCLGTRDRDWLNQKSSKNFWLDTLFLKLTNDFKEPYTTIMKELANKIAILFINQYLNHPDCLSPFGFNSFVEYINDNYFKDDKIEILKRCSTVTPLAKRIYEQYKND